MSLFNPAGRCLKVLPITVNISHMTQWHPIFAQLLRPAVEEYYEVQTTVPVGDAPRETDFVLLRRTASEPTPFQGLWQFLTAWNILEFKGPTVSARRGDVELLVELDFGIDRRLRSRWPSGKTRTPAPQDVSFWYLANRLGRSFLRGAENTLGGLEALGPGLWRGRALGHPISLVSSIDLPVEEDSLPLHLVGPEPLDTERQMARLVMEQPKLQRRYGGWLASLHPKVWREVEAMAKTAGRRLQIDLRPAIESLGLDRVLEQVGIDRVIETVGEKEVIKRIGWDRILASLSPAERRELKKRLE